MTPDRYDFHMRAAERYASMARMLHDPELSDRMFKRAKTERKLAANIAEALADSDAHAEFQRQIT